LGEDRAAFADNQPGPERKDDRLILSGIMHVLKVGCRWVDCWSVVHQILQDVNAPIYCLLAHAGSLLFALSNQSLRFPALVFGSIAPLWIYDTNVHDTVARTFPPRITELASAWQCRDFGSPPIGILACTRKDAT
jgi:hypothetical protein